MRRRHRIIKTYHRPQNDDQPTWIHRVFADGKKKKRPVAKKKKRLRKHYKGNPYKRGEEPPKPWKTKLYAIIGIASFGIMVGMLFFHPYFYVSRVHTTGLSQIDETEFTTAVIGMTEYKRWFVFPANNIFFVDVEELRDIIKERYPVTYVMVQKEFPNKVIIEIEEKISQLIYDNGTTYSYIDLQGKHIETIAKVEPEEWNIQTERIVTTSTDGSVDVEEKEISRTHIPNHQRISSQHGDFPIVYDARQQPIGDDVSVLKPATIERLVFWYSLLKRRGGYTVSYVELDHELGDVTFVIDNRWRLHVKLDDAERQFDILDIVTSEKVSLDEVSYIDVRYGERVYWQ